MRKITCMALTALMVLTLFCPVLAEDNPAQYPASFDLRSVDTDGDGIGDRCYVTPVRAQYPYGSCWGFASIAAAESSILGSILEDDPDAWKTLDLSEKQVVFFSHSHIEDPASSQYGEGTYPLEFTSWEDIYTGGTTFLATNTYAAGIGPVYESRDESYEYRGREGKTESVTRPDGVTYEQYAIDDDWSLDESFRFQQDFVLKEAYLLPAPTTTTYDWTTMASSTEFNEEAINAVKEQLMQKRAVTVGFCADISRPWEGGDPMYMNAETWAHYTWEVKGANHAVTIIGWDDNYSKENFLADHMPPADGAWLVKNSWGSGENEFPDRGRGDWGIPVEKTDADGNVVLDDDGNPVTVASGYFWLSYYDLSMTEFEAFIFDTAINFPQLGLLSNDRIIRHQYDLMPALAMQEQPADEEIKAANIFTADRQENLFYITYQIAKANTTAQWEVYMLAPDWKTPEDGILIASGEEFHKYGGFYMHEIWPFLALKEGQTYSIVLTESKPDGSYSLNMPYGYGKNYPLMPSKDDDFSLGAPEYSVAVVNERESMVYFRGEWLDWSHAFDYVDLFGGEQQLAFVKSADACLDNFPIKGLLIQGSNDYRIGVAGNPEELVLKAGGEPVTLDLDIYVPGFEDRPVSYFGVSWALAGGDTTCAGITADEDGAHAQLTPLHEGNTWLFVHSDGLGTTMIPVTVQ